MERDHVPEPPHLLLDDLGHDVRRLVPQAGAQLLLEQRAELREVREPRERLLPIDEDEGGPAEGGHAGPEEAQRHVLEVLEGRTGGQGDGCLTLADDQLGLLDGVRVSGHLVRRLLSDLRELAAEELLHHDPGVVEPPEAGAHLLDEPVAQARVEVAGGLVPADLHHLVVHAGHEDVLALDRGESGAVLADLPLEVLVGRGQRDPDVPDSVLLLPADPQREPRELRREKHADAVARVGRLVRHGCPRLASRVFPYACARSGSGFLVLDQPIGSRFFDLWPAESELSLQAWGYKKLPQIALPRQMGSLVLLSGISRESP